jgi:hypothetical protein
MANSIVHQAEADSASRPAEPGKARKGVLSQFWTAVRDACAEIKEEVRMIVG